MTRISPRPHLPEETPDLQTQLEDMFDSVWKAEADWRFDDRIGLSLSLRPDHARRPGTSPQPRDPDASAPPVI